MKNTNPIYNLNQSVVDKIKQIRASLHLNQAQFSELINVSPSVYSRIEKGERDLSLNFIQHVAEKTNISLQDFFSFSGNVYNVDQHKGIQNQFSNPVIHIHINDKQFGELKDLLK